MSVIAVRRLEFVRAPGDRLVTGRVVLDPGGATYRMTLWWRPECRTWYLDLSTTGGDVIVTSAPVRDRTDCLLGVSSPGRPRGAIVSYDPQGRGEPTLTSYSDGTTALYYLPDGFNPADFTLYTTAVA